MSRRALGLAAALVVALALGLALAMGVGSSDDTASARPEVPRPCWFSDYDNKRLSNACEYDESSGTWLLEVGGRLVPAAEQRLPEANLCHYFHGTRCPDRKDAK